MTTAAVAQPVRRMAAAGDRFFTWMALACLVVAGLGFAPSYWIPVASGSIAVSPLTHLHGLLFSGWLLFFVMQTALVARGRTGFHRELGIAGVAIATAMFFVGMGVAIHRMRELDAAGYGEIGRRFSVVPVTAIAIFAVLVAFAIRYRNNPAIHKRLMLVATVSLMQPAVGRATRMLLASPTPEALAGGLPLPPPVQLSVVAALLADVLLVIAMIHDRRTMGRVHPVYWMAGGALLAVQVLRVPLSATDAWLRFAQWIVAFAP
jgi:hypothetical protein